MLGETAQNFFRETHCPPNTPGFARSSVGTKGEAVPRDFEFIVLPDQKLTTGGGETRQTALIAALVNGKVMSCGSRALPGVTLQRSSRRCKISRAARAPPQFRFVEVTKHASGFWRLSSRNRKNAGGKCSGLSYSWHAGINTCVNELCRLKESTSKRSTIVNRSPSMMAVTQTKDCKVQTTKFAPTVKNSCNHDDNLRTILLILEDKSIKFKNTSEPFRDKISTVLSSLVVTYEMEKPKDWAYVSNVAQPTPIQCEAEAKDVPYPPGAYEFAKAHGYDFIRLKACRLKCGLGRTQHQKNKSPRIMDQKRSKSLTGKKELTACGRKCDLQRTECEAQHCEETKRLYNYPSSHILDSVVNDAEFLESTNEDIERPGKISRKPSKLGVTVSCGNNRESTKSPEDRAEVKERLRERVEAPLSIAPLEDYKEDLRKAYTQISQERPGSKTFSISENGAMKNSEKDCSSTVEFLAEESGSSTVLSILPRLSDKTSKEYKMYNSLSATIFRETQLAKKHLAHELNERNSSTEKFFGTCGEIHRGGDRVEHNILKQAPPSPVYYFNGSIDDMRLEEMSPFESHPSVGSLRDHLDSETEDDVFMQQSCSMDESLVSDNCNNNALPELQLSLDDLRNDFSYSEDEDDTNWEPRRPREPSHSSCQVNEDTYTASKQNTASKGLLRLPLLLNNSSRRLTTSKKPVESASPIPPIASLKPAEDQCTRPNVKKCRRVKKEVESTPYLFDLHKERVPDDLKSVRSKRRPTRLSPVVLKQSSNVSHNINGQGDPQIDEPNPSNAERKPSSNAVFSASKTSGLLSPCLVEDRRTSLGLQQSTRQHAFGESAVSPRLVISKQRTFLRSPDFAGFGSIPELSVTSVLAKETRFLPDLIQSENVFSNTNIIRGGNSNSSPPPNINNSHSLNINNSSNRSRTFGISIKNKAKASPIISGQRNLNLNYNAVTDRGKSSKRKVDSSRKLCQYQDKFIDELGRELETLIETHLNYQRSEASDINTSNITRRLGHYREPAFENTGRAIRFGNMRQTKPTRHVNSGRFLQVAVPFNLPQRNADRDYRLWSVNINSRKSLSVPNQSEVAGSDTIPVQKNSESEIFHRSTYAPYAHFPTTEIHDRPANYCDRQLTPEENSSDSNNAISKYYKNDQQSVFTGHFHQGGAEESMDVEETTTEGARYEVDLLSICRKLDERLQFSQGTFPRSLETWMLSFNHKLEYLLRLVKGNTAHTASNDDVGQEENASSSHQFNNESNAGQSEPDTVLSGYSHTSPLSETNLGAVRGILKTIETSDETKAITRSRKRVVAQSEKSLKCVATSSPSLMRRGSKKIKKHFHGKPSKRNSKTSSKKHRRPRNGSHVHKGVRPSKEKVYRPLNTHPRSKSKKAETSYHSHQHSRACRRRHATDGTCCNVCLQRAVAALNKRLSFHDRKKNCPHGIEKKAAGAKRKSAGFAKAYCHSQKCQKTRVVSSKRRIKKRKHVVRKTYRSRNRTSNNSNRTSNKIGLRQRATINQNCNQNSRQRKREKRSTSRKVTRRRKATRPEISYVITPKGQKTIYEDLQKRYKHLLQYVHNLNSSAKGCADLKHSDVYVQNLAMRFRNLVTNFPKHKLRTLENIFKKYQDVSERYQDKSPNSSASSIDYCQTSKAKPRSLKRKRPMDEPHASNAYENVYSKTRRNKSYNSKNGADRLPARSTNKKMRTARPVDSLIIARRRLAERGNKSRNACLQTVNMASNTCVFHAPAQKQSFDFSRENDSDTRADRSVSNSGSISSCSSCENMVNACIFQPLYLFQKSSPSVSATHMSNFGIVPREAHSENYLVQKANTHFTSQRLFLNELSSSAVHPNLKSKLPTNTPIKDGKDPSLQNCFLGTHANQQGTAKLLFPTNHLHNDFQQLSMQGMIANTQFKQHCTDQPNSGNIFSQLCSNSMLRDVSVQAPIVRNNVVSIDDEGSLKSPQQGFFPKTLSENSTELCPNKSKPSSVSNQTASLGVIENTGKENVTWREQLVTPAFISKFSSPLWGGVEPQFDNSYFNKSHLCDSNETQNVSLSTNNSEDRANNNINSESTANVSCLRNHSSEIPHKSVTTGTQNLPLFVIHSVDEHTHEVCLRENNPSTSSAAQPDSQDKTNNSMECKHSKKEIQKSHEPRIEPFWERVQPYFIAHSPGISTTWKCYYDSPKINSVAINNPTTVPNTISSNKIFAGATTKQINVSHEPRIEPFWERVQPYLIAHSPGISTTWKCYYDSPKINSVAINNPTKVSNTISANKIFAGATTTKKINECASQHLIADETNASAGCSQALEDITARPGSESFEVASAIEQPSSTETASETNTDVNANDNARNLRMSWSANTTQEFGNLFWETRCNRIDDFRNTGSTSMNPWAAHKNCVNAMVFFPTTACISRIDPFFTHAHAKTIDSREINENSNILCHGALAQKCFAGLSSSKKGVYRNSSLVSATESVGQFNDKSTSCSNQRTSLETLNNCREVVMQEARISNKIDISNRKRHAKAPLSDSLVPPCKIPKLETQSCSDQMSYRHCVSKHLRRTRFQLMRELRYLNKWQEAKEKLSRYQESQRISSLITIDRDKQYDASSDADSESSL